MHIQTWFIEGIMSDKLKPCKICGSPADEKLAKNGRVRCSNLACGLSRIPVYFEVWQRPTFQEQQAEIERLNEENKQINEDLCAVCDELEEERQYNAGLTDLLRNNVKVLKSIISHTDDKGTSIAIHLLTDIISKSKTLIKAKAKS